MRIFDSLHVVFLQKGGYRFCFGGSSQVKIVLPFSLISHTNAISLFHYSLELSQFCYKMMEYIIQNIYLTVDGRQFSRRLMFVEGCH